MNEVSEEKDILKDVDEEWKKDMDVEKIKEAIELSKKRFDFTKEKLLYEKVPYLKPEEVLEKFVVLSQLMDPEMRLYLNEGQNPFSKTIFGELFAGYSQEELYNLYMRLNKKYASELNRFQNSEIMRISTYTGLVGRRTLETCNLTFV